MLSATAEYALRAAVYLAQSYGESKTTSQIAEMTKVPQGYLSKILQSMVRKHLLSSQRGLGGGFQLLREPTKINVLEVLEAVDAPPQRIHHCPLGLPTHTILCPVHRLVDNAIAEVEKAFAGATLASLVESAEGAESLCSEVPGVSVRS